MNRYVLKFNCAIVLYALCRSDVLLYPKRDSVRIYSREM